MKNSESKKAVFIVGSARSGTTLLQSMLASHPEVYSFPETHFFRGTIPKFSFLRWLKFYGEKDKEFIRQFLNRVNRNELDVKIPSTTFSTTEWVKGLLDLLDSLSQNSTEKIWVEKTPMHLYFASLIENVRQETNFIHIIRDGKDVVASLFDASEKTQMHLTENNQSKSAFFAGRLIFKSTKSILGNRITILFFIKILSIKLKNLWDGFVIS